MGYSQHTCNTQFSGLGWYLRTLLAILWSLQSGQGCDGSIGREQEGRIQHNNNVLCCDTWTGHQWTHRAGLGPGLSVLLAATQSRTQGGGTTRGVCLVQGHMQGCAGMEGSGAWHSVRDCRLLGRTSWQGEQCKPAVFLHL